MRHWKVFDLWRKRWIFRPEKIIGSEENKIGADKEKLSPLKKKQEGVRTDQTDGSEAVFDVELLLFDQPSTHVQALRAFQQLVTHRLHSPST